jgi:micrococcal nuclease
VRERATTIAAALLLAACAPAPAVPAARTVVVTRIVDGDTFDARDGDRTVRVRLIGIDTPELHPSAKLDAQLRRGWDATLVRRLARRAAAAARRLLAGRTVRLELDVETHDKYGRLLAYVWADDLLVNAELLRQGQARLLTIPPNVRYADRFARLAAAARAARRGLWASWPPVRRDGAAAAPHRVSASTAAARRSTRRSGEASSRGGTRPGCARRARSMASQSRA